MLEGFKINCFPLNRAIRISIALPKNYNNTTRHYPIIYFLDGQNLYKDEDSYRNTSLNLEETIERLALEQEKEALYVGIAAAGNPERREQEYQNTTLANFILSSIHPYLSSRYRINSYVYAVASSKASYQALLLNQSDVFKGCILLSPLLDFKKLGELNLIHDNLYFFYAGKNEVEGNCLKTVEELKKYLKEPLIVVDENQLHNEIAWRKILYSALNYLVL